MNTSFLSQNSIKLMKRKHIQVWVHGRITQMVIYWLKEMMILKRDIIKVPMIGKDTTIKHSK